MHEPSCHFEIASLKIRWPCGNLGTTFSKGMQNIQEAILDLSWPKQSKVKSKDFQCQIRSQPFQWGEEKNWSHTLFGLAGTEKLVASCRKTGVKSRNESLDLPAISGEGCVFQVLQLVSVLKAISKRFYFLIIACKLIHVLWAVISKGKIRFCHYTCILRHEKVCCIMTQPKANAHSFRKLVGFELQLRSDWDWHLKIADCAITPSEFAKEEDPDTRKVQWIVKQKNTKIALKSILEIQRFLEKHGLSR